MAKDLAVGTTSELDEIVDISADEEFFYRPAGQAWHDLAHQDNYLVIIVTHDLGITKVVDEVMRMSDGYLTINS